jgi:hypothetical protein
MSGKSSGHKRSNPGAVITPPRLGRTRYTQEQARLLCHCTDLDIGQKRYGGWKIEWIKKFITA